MKADLPLDERCRVEREREQEIRDALVRQHFEVTTGQQLVAAAVLDHDLRMGAQAMAVLTVGAERAVVAAPAPSAPTVVITEREKPDTLRTKLGLS